MHDLGYLPDVLRLLCASIFVVVLLHRLKISPVLGYLIVGAMIGEHGFNLIAEPSYAAALAEFGVVFLLFVIGLELTVERLIKMRLHVFGFGGLQLILTTTILIAIFHFILSSWVKIDFYVAIVISAALSLSSTAIILKVLAEGGKQATSVGRLSLAVLLMQDFAVVPLLAILPILGKQEGNILFTIEIAGLKALGAILVITVCGRLFLRPFFSLIASVKTDEVYVTTTLLIVLGAAWITSELGLSTAMGAFIAGLLIAETEYRNRVEDSIMPFQGLFMSLFFLSVGMSIDWRFIVEHLRGVLLFSGALISIKFIIMLMLCMLFRMRLGLSLHAALLLSQGSEFAFILFGLAVKQGSIDQSTGQFLLMAVAITMAVTPLLSIIGNKIEEHLDTQESFDGNQEFKGVSDLSEHVVIAGFGRVGRVVAYMLQQEQISYIAVDSNAMLARRARSEGFPVYHGDLSDSDTLKAIGADRAAAVILTMSDKVSIRKSTKNIHANYKNLTLVSRVEDLKHSKGIKKLGASETVPTTIETGLQLGGVILKNLGVIDQVVLAIKEKIRKNNYALTEEIELFE